MNSYTVSKYANAYFNVVRDANAFSLIEADLRVLKPVFEKYSCVFKGMDGPTVNMHSRILFVQKILTEYKFHKLTKNLLNVLAEYGCLGILGQVISQYLELHKKLKKELSLDVISVQKLNVAEINCIKNFFHKEFKRKITLNNILDPSILGGLILKTGSFVLDGSVANRLRTLEFTLHNESN